MSKIAFISDIHGNFFALKSVLLDIKSRKVDSIYCLGDLVGYYSQINEVIDTVRANGIPCIMGNHDYALAHNNGVISRSRTCTNVLSRQLGYISCQNFDFLMNLDDSISVQNGNYKIFAVHGGLNDHVDEYITELDEHYFSSLHPKYTHVITAHNHKAEVRSFNNISYANSGSVGQPRDHNPNASYVIFENGVFNVVRVRYDIDATINEMSKAGYPEYISEVLRRGYRIGE